VNQQDHDRLTEVFRLQANLCKSLAEPKRLMAVHELRHGPCSVGELAQRLGIRQSTMSQILAVLRQSGVITATRQGNTVNYQLQNPKITLACDIVREVIAEELQRQHDIGRGYIKTLSPEAANVPTE
jgi:ArsR family transcriptional regulator